MKVLPVGYLVGVYYLRGGAVELLQTVLQTFTLGGQVFALLAQQAAVQLDLLQEGLGCGVVVAPLIGQILPGRLVHTGVNVGHEFTHRLLHFRL